MEASNAHADSLEGQLVSVHYPKGKVGTVISDVPNRKAEAKDPARGITRRGQKLKPLVVKFEDGSQGAYHYDQVTLWDEAHSFEQGCDCDRCVADILRRHPELMKELDKSEPSPMNGLGIVSPVEKALALDTQISACQEVEGARHLVPDLREQRREIVENFNYRQRNSYWRQSNHVKGDR